MNRRNLVFFLFLVLGLGLLNYPFVSQWVNRQSQSQVVYNHMGQTVQLSGAEKESMLRDAEAYNRALAQSTQKITDGFSAPQDADSAYEDLLNPAGDGIMGYLEIPAIDVALPIYHGTGTVALENGVGHLVQSSLPVGGADTHAVLSAHTGLATKTLFTDLDQMKTGDVFYVHVLDTVLAYAVEDIETVLPHETDSLRIVPGEDLVTLVTCTPYGINSHRLLVTGRRVALTQEEVHQMQTETVQTGPWKWDRVVFWVSLAVLLISGILLLKPKRKGGKRNRE